MPSFPLLKNSNVKYFLQQSLHHLLPIRQAVLKMQNCNVFFFFFTDYLTTFIAKYYPYYAIIVSNLFRASIAAS